SPPGDWESPVPTYFLAVAPDSVFRFAVVGRDCTAPQVEDDVAKAAEWLQKALQNLGAGAKTSVGYGYFGEPRPSQ
ncbi:MAG TPA: type III-B CRISPR module RAMP protein Cmr6, partial [Chthonomonadales bacterium]|nr:type III-B CRISPR module RAMP protein Cmr6 [Chthonomonadales bacterium]